MNLKIGIVGLPNVGKSTLFNALLKKQQALAANYPFATIEPNVGVVPVPDERLVKLAEITKDEEKMASLPPIKSATIEFVDIAGLVKGASEGAGLGNKFLSHIREVQIIAHVVRAFADENVIKEGAVDPKTDYDTITTELILADLQTLLKQKDSKAVKADPAKKSAIDKLYTALDSGKAARTVLLTEEERDSVKDLFLLSAKPELIVLNVSEGEYTPAGIETVTNKYIQQLQVSRDSTVVICAKIEEELSSLSTQEQIEYLHDLGLQASGLERLIQKAYGTLDLISFLTCGEKEVRAWTIKKDITAQNAAGVIHNDFIKHFIKAEVVSYVDFVSLGGWKKARENGKARFEGRDYIMKDGDVVEFKIGQ
jgi:GTP-binding protein YchF